MEHYFETLLRDNFSESPIQRVLHLSSPHGRANSFLKPAYKLPEVGANVVTFYNSNKKAIAEAAMIEGYYGAKYKSTSPL
jgi:hypothetical protein